ncbi:MAG: protein kinase domain-containing protein [Gemmatimonadales bacterium]
MSTAADRIGRLRSALAGRYTVEGEIGRGGMSVVYHARDMRLDRDVAVKVLRPELTVALGADRFLREIQIAARLQHPHIVPLHESGEADGLFYYVMPFVAGESLRARLREHGPLSVSEAVRIAGEIGSALTYAHEQGFIHRDVKPENILLSSGLAMVADFGIAQALVDAGVAPLTDSGVIVGTPGYMSPEQSDGQSKLDARTDVYSLGCVVYEMLAGEPPFTGPTARAVLARHIHDRPPSIHVIRPGVPPTIEQTVNRALEKSPADRFASAAEFGAALAASDVKEVDSSGWRRLLVPVVVSTVVVLGGWLAWQRWGQPATASPPPSPDPTRMAVLYFSDRSENGTLRHVAHGLTEDLIDKLSTVSALNVVSPGGVRPYSDKAIPLDSIARSLRVGTIVEGSVERPGTQLRVRVRLIDAATGQQIEATQIERPWGDLFALQAQLADSVSRFLRVRLGRELRLREQQAATRSVPAWDLMRQAETLAQDAEAVDPVSAGRLLDQADVLLARAERVDPRWREPIIARGWLMARQADWHGFDAQAGWLEKALGHAERALRLNPDDPRALELRGTLRLSLWQLPATDSAQQAGLMQQAEEDLRSAVLGAPGLARAWNALSLIYQQKGDWVQADVMLRRALQADAYLTETARSMQVLMFAALERGDTAAARSWCTTGRSQFPNDFHLWECELTLLGWLSNRRSDVPRAWSLVETIEQRDTLSLIAMGWGVRRLMVAALLARAGLSDSARRVMRATRAAAAAPVLEGLELYEAMVLTELRDHDGAFRALDSLVQRFPQARSYIATARWFTPLHDDPRFARVFGRGAADTLSKRR